MRLSSANEHISRALTQLGALVERVGHRRLDEAHAYHKAREAEKTLEAQRAALSRRVHLARTRRQAAARLLTSTEVHFTRATAASTQLRSALLCS